ncbi:MAG: STAS domain-containing protein [Vicinamibacterales bacterium]
MLRLERAEDAHTGVTLHVHGRIGGEWVTEFERACDEAIAQCGPPLRLDLLRVTYIDQAGLAALRRLWPQLTIVRASLFARELLKPIEHD